MKAPSLSFFTFILGLGLGAVTAGSVAQLDKIKYKSERIEAASASLDQARIIGQRAMLHSWLRTNHTYLAPLVVTNGMTVSNCLFVSVTLSKPPAVVVSGSHINLSTVTILDDQKFDFEFLHLGPTTNSNFSGFSFRE